MEEVLYEDGTLNDANIIGWMDNPDAVFLQDNQSGASQADVLKLLKSDANIGGRRGKASEYYAEERISSGNVAYSFESQPQQPAPETNVESKTKRMVNYSGNISLESSEPEAVIDTVIQKAAEKGGSMNARRNGYVSLQIPVKEFRNFFEYVLTLGAVKNKSIWASDITSQYQDNNSRLIIAQTSLTRYKELLALAKTEQEKLSLLKEIQRISEEIEQREILEKELLKKAAFSTIELYAHNTPKPKPIFNASKQIGAFRWFNLLESNRATTIGDALKLSVPKDFIETINEKEIWRTASALNAEFWAFERNNNPHGDVDFWANAILNFFKDKYKAELTKTENYSLIRLQTSEANARVFYIAVLKISDEKKLKIAEAYFPNLDAEKRNGDAVKEVLGGVK